MINYTVIKASVKKQKVSIIQLMFLYSKGLVVNTCQISVRDTRLTNGYSVIIQSLSCSFYVITVHSDHICNAPKRKRKSYSKNDHKDGPCFD